MIRNHKEPVRISILLTIAISSLVGLSVGTVLYFTASSNYQNTLSAFAGSARLLLNNIELGVSSHLSPANEILLHMQHLAESGELDHKTPDELTLILKGALAAPHQISGIELWDPEHNGISITHHDDAGFNIEIEHEENAHELKIITDLAGHEPRIYWDAPFFHEGETSLLAYIHLHKQGRNLGAASTGVSINQLSEFTSKLGAAHNMTAFVLYKDQYILAHPELLDKQVLSKMSANNTLLNIDVLKTPILKALLTQGKPARPPTEDGFVIRRLMSENGGYFMFTKTLTGFSPMPWTIGVYTRATNIDQQIRRMQFSIYIGLGLFFLSVLASVFLARSIAAPIRNTSMAAAKIGRLEIDQVQPLPPSSIKELNSQANAFNRMLDALNWFNTYVPSRLVKQLIAGDGHNLIQSRTETLTVMFTDIMGFTTLSETMTPKEIATLLNTHFEILNQCIEDTGGTLDKYIGDAVMAFWGAPEQQEDHTIRACKTALSIERMLSKTSGPRIKIGLHTGPLVVGNIGAKVRMNYTVIGDSVNVCARIESLCGDLDTGQGAATILISEATKNKLNDDFNTTAAGEFQVKGRVEPVRIWRLSNNIVAG